MSVGVQVYVTAAKLSLAVRLSPYPLQIKVSPVMFGAGGMGYTVTVRVAESEQPFKVALKEYVPVEVGVTKVEVALERKPVGPDQ